MREHLGRLHGSFFKQSWKSFCVSHCRFNRLLHTANVEFFSWKKIHSSMAYFWTYYYFEKQLKLLILQLLCCGSMGLGFCPQSCRGVV